MRSFPITPKKEQIGTKEDVSFVEHHVAVYANYVGQYDEGELIYWTTSAKEVKLKAGSEVQRGKATSSPFARMLV